MTYSTCMKTKTCQSEQSIHDGNADDRPPR